MRRYVIAQKAGKRMRRFRKEAKLTQEEIASKAGLHFTTYGRIERGEINPPLQTLNKIAQALKTSLSKLLG